MTAEIPKKTFLLVSLTIIDFSTKFKIIRMSQYPSCYYIFVNAFYNTHKHLEQHTISNV